MPSSTYPSPRIIVIDDDPEYCDLMRASAMRVGINLYCFDSLASMGRVGLLKWFDAAILDYRLQQMNGLEIAEYVDALLGHLPVLLISASDLTAVPKEQWPRCVKEFVPKNVGVQIILAKAVELAGFSSAGSNPLRGAELARAPAISSSKNRTRPVDHR